MIAVAGATGYIGGLLARSLLADGAGVRVLARDPQRAADLAALGCEVRRADVLDPDSIREGLDGCDAAHYLVHSMGRGSSGDFAARDRAGARTFATAAAAAGLERIVYLGGLGQGSEHLASRHETARVLGSGDVPLVYLRAAAVIGAGSESFRTILYLVRRLPLMVTPRWVTTKTQPIAVADVVEYLRQATARPGLGGRELQIGGPDVTTYGGMIDALARVVGRRPPLRISVPVLSPRLSSLWIGLVTPVDPGIARPLIEGLSSETVITDPSGMEAFEVTPTPMVAAMRLAIEEAERG